MEPRVHPRIGLVPVGHHYYWDQYPTVLPRSQAMFGRLRVIFDQFGDVVTCELVDSPERSQKAGQLLRRERVDIVFVFPFGYTPSMNVIPAAREIDVPLRILNAHEEHTYDYTAADTAFTMHYGGVCCVPELAGALTSIGTPFKVRTGAFDDQRLMDEIRADCLGAAAARFFRQMKVGVIGETYTGMVDMPIDEHRLLRATGQLVVRPEVEEVENAFHRVTDQQLEAMYRQLREMYEVDETVTNEHLRFSAQVAVAFDEVIRKHDLYAFGFYWWGERDLMTQLRAQAALAVSRLAALGRPGVTEGDVKSAMAMKILDLLGAGGMFIEFFSMDFAEGFFLMGHDGPSNINMAKARPQLKLLDVLHGKSGYGLGIDFEIREGPATILNLSQFAANGTFKLIYSIVDVIPGPTLRIGNPNCRVRVRRRMHEFMDAWCQQGPSHHIALGHGDQSAALEAFAETMCFSAVKV